MRTNYKSVTARILRHLSMGLPLTTNDAQTFGSSGTALPRRIKDLRDEGHQIKIARVPYTRADGQKVYISQYSLQ